MHSLRIRLVSSRFRRLPRRRCTRSRGTTCGPDEKKGPFADLRKLESNVSRALGFFHDKLKLGLKFAAAWEATLGHIRACVANERRKFRALAHRAITLGERQEEGTTVFELTRASNLFLARPTMRATLDRMLNKKLGTRFKVIPSIAC